MKGLKSIFESQKAKQQKAKEADISSKFYIKEKNSKLWIIHEGYAVLEIDKSKTAEEIVSILNQFRATAIKY